MMTPQYLNANGQSNTKNMNRNLLSYGYNNVNPNSCKQGTYFISSPGGSGRCVSNRGNCEIYNEEVGVCSKCDTLYNISHTQYGSYCKIKPEFLWPVVAGGIIVITLLTFGQIMCCRDNRFKTCTECFLYTFCFLWMKDCCSKCRGGIIFNI